MTRFSQFHVYCNPGEGFRYRITYVLHHYARDEVRRLREAGIDAYVCIEPGDWVLR